MWEGQLRLAIKDGSLLFLFENKGDIYNGRGFEIALTQHCRPDLVLNAFTSLLSLFNDVQGNDEPILQYWSWFDSLIMELSCCKVAIPQMLLVMLFLWAIHSCYLELLHQFWTRFKSIESATINLFVEDIAYHDSFTVHECKGAKPPGPNLCVPAAATANTDQKGTIWQKPFKWLSKPYGRNGIKLCWTRAIAGMGICPICHCKDKPWHVPTKCPLLVELTLKLEIGSPQSLPAPAPPASPAPALGPSQSPGGRVATADALLTGSSLGSIAAPSGLTAATSRNLPAVDEYDSDKDFCWAGDKDGLDYEGAGVDQLKSNACIAAYPTPTPSCNHS
jgi:hypothetical protein